MAWALKEPIGFGKYWPDGSYKHWYDELREHAVATRSSMSKEFEAEVFDDENNNLFISPFVEKFTKNRRLVVEEEAPKYFHTSKKYTELHSMLSSESRILLVDEDLKSLIEEFEPGVHQFFPIAINMPKGKVYPKHYYILVIGSFLEAYLPVEGTFNSSSGGGKRFFSLSHTKKEYNQLQLSKEVIASSHLWRDTRMASPNVFISDALQETIKESGLTIFVHHKVKEV